MFDELFPIMSTADLPAMLAFYRDLLGGTVMYQFPPEGEPGYVALTIGRSHLGITVDGQAQANDRVTLWAYATDCDAEVARLAAAGVPVVEPPADQPWGERMATVRDPDGNRVIVATRATPAG